jgi:radical SAM superfamily enzyme YgiQ (UPF0313 family)
VPSLSPGFRVHPIDDILLQITYDDFPHWWQRKVIWFWDDNLTAKRAYIKDLLRAMIPLKRWWLTQASLDIAKDEELLDLMEQSGCIGVFFGIETFGEESLKDAHKRQNKVQQYHEAVEALHRHGIAVMAGFIAGFDGDSPQAIVEMADRLYEIGIDVPFLSVLTPFRGTPLYDKMMEEGRMLDDRDWAFYNGYNVTFQPKQMPPEALLEAHRALWKRAFSFWYSARRVLRSLFRLRLGALCLVIAMNSFYCGKRLRGNTPVDMRRRAARSVALAGESTSPRSEVLEQGLG